MVISYDFMGLEWGYHGVSGDIMGYYMNIYIYYKYKHEREKERERERESDR